MPVIREDNKNTEDRTKSQKLMLTKFPLDTTKPTDTVSAVKGTKMTMEDQDLLLQNLKEGPKPPASSKKRQF